MGDLIVHAHVVRHDDHGVLQLLLQAHQHHQNASLHHHVQSGGGLVGQHHVGGHEGCQGDDDTLSHTAGELEGEGLQDIGREAQLFQILGDTVQSLLFSLVLPVLFGDGVDELLLQTDDGFSTLCAAWGT